MSLYLCFVAFAKCMSMLIRLYIPPGVVLYNGKIAGLKLFALPPPSRQGKNCCDPPSIWLNFQASVLKLPQNVLCTHTPILGMAISTPFVCVKIHLPPRPFCIPLLPILNARSLTYSVQNKVSFYVLHHPRRNTLDDVMNLLPCFTTQAEPLKWIHQTFLF